METSTKEETVGTSTAVKTAAAGLSTKAVVLIVAAAVVVVAAIAAVAVVLTHQNQGSDDLGIGYATEAKVMLDQDSLQAAVDAAMENARKGNISLMYKDNAYSDDGSTFSCYIVNSASNAFDMFLSIYADPQMTDELYLSQLVPPGSGFEEITLERPLSKGDHEVYVALTQVETDEETGEQTIRNQVVHTMDFHVTA
jgi:hypothetical protein